MTAILYRYRDSESVIKPMEGYTPGEGWAPLYDKAAIDAAVAAERERCAKVCEEQSINGITAPHPNIEDIRQIVCGVMCADAIRKGE